MNLYIEASASEHVKIFINGKLGAELAVKEVISYDNLVEEVRQARAAVCLVKSLPSYLKRLPVRQDTKEVALGFIDGLARATIPHPSPGAPPIRPNYTKDYSLGYDLGEFLTNVSKCVLTPRE